MRSQHMGVLPIASLLRIHAPATFGRPAHQKGRPEAPFYFAAPVQGGGGVAVPQAENTWVVVNRPATIELKFSRIAS
jgi:hypothetical protein